MDWLSQLFGGGKNPADAAMPYLDKIPGQTSQYLDPYFQAGKSMLPGLEKEYGSLTSDPGGFLNKIGASYQQSPGFQSALKNALTAGNHAAAAGGMAGTPEHQFTSMGTATDLANQDYNQWLQQATGMFNTGIAGQQDMAHQGQQAGTSMADMIAQMLAQKGAYAYQGQAGQNAANSGLFGNLTKGLIGGLSTFSNPIGGFASGIANMF